MAPTTTHCAGCDKPLAGKPSHRIGVQPEGQPETIQHICNKCARRMVRNITRQEKQQGVLIA